VAEDETLKNCFFAASSEGGADGKLGPLDSEEFILLATPMVVKVVKNKAKEAAASASASAAASAATSAAASAAADAAAATAQAAVKKD
jgi:hypothetical protein